MTERAWPTVKVYQLGADRHRWARGVLERAAKARGLSPTRAELTGWAAVAAHETQYGTGWKPPMTGSNNWGAVQATAGQPSRQWQDTHPDGTVYQQAFRVYATPEEGAGDVIRHLTTLRPKTAAVMPSGDWWAVADAMRQERYFGGYCPKAAKQYGSAVRGVGSGSVESWPEAQRACHLEAFPQYASILREYAKQIANAHNEKPLDEQAGEGAAWWPWLVVAGAGAWWYWRRKA